MAKKVKWADKLVRMKCKKCARAGHYTTRRKGLDKKLELSMHCKWCNDHTSHKETRITGK